MLPLMAVDTHDSFVLYPRHRTGVLISRRLNVPVKITIPVSALQPVVSGDVWKIELQLFIVARDEGGGQFEVVPIPLVFTSDEMPEAPAVVTYEATVTVRRKTAALAVTVYDTNSGDTLSTVVTRES